MINLKLVVVLGMTFPVSLTLAASPPQVSIETGALRGAIHEGVVSFKGIPFAAPPVGELRWRPPQAPTHWSGVRPATDFGHDCMQLPAPSEAAPAGVTTPNEDCLVLNVWAPAGKASHLPVMVWIYGGGFVNGASSPPVYDGSNFAKKGVVFVSFNYRVGRFGFFAHPALTREAGSGPVGNYGYMDQIAALEWVKRNAAAFGGDATNVTIFGESAGGSSVQMLLASPAARGLFQKAIVESGGGRDSGIPRRVRQGDAVSGIPTSGEMLGQAFAKANGIAGVDTDALAKLRKLSPKAVVANLNILTRRADPSLNATFPGPMIDGQIVVETAEAAYRAGRQEQVPVIIGANDNDLAYPQGNTVAALLAPFGDEREMAESAYDPEHTKNVHDIGLRVASDRAMMEPARFVARLLSSQGQPVYLYRFSYVATSMRAAWPGATHASEVPYAFDTLHARYGDATTADDQAVATTMHAYWVAFAKSGDPNGGGGTKWPLFNQGQNLVTNFTSKGVVVQPDPLRVRLDLTERTHAPKSVAP